MGLGLLAVYEDKEALVHKHFAEALLQRHGAIVYHGYALALAYLGCTTEAIEQLRLAVNTVDTDAIPDRLAGLALALGADELIPEILEKARKLKVKGENLTFAALQIGLVYDDDEEAYIARMNVFLPNDMLRKHSERITDEEWQEMCDFADSLQQYI